MINKSFGTKLLIFLGIVAFSLAFLLFIPEDKVTLAEKSTVIVGDVAFDVDVARTNSERMQGLSGRESLGEDEGMLFIFESPQMLSFWMKDMNFSLDMVWIDENLVVSDISKNITPDTYPQSFSPKVPSQYVLEVNAGMSDSKGIEVGDKVILSI